MPRSPAPTCVLSGGKFSTNCVTRTTVWPRTSASSAGERPSIHCPIPRFSSASRASASSTSSIGVGSPSRRGHDSNSSIARCAIVPFAFAVVHSNSSGRRWCSSQSSTDAMRCFEIQTSSSTSRRAAKWSSAARISPRSSSTNPGSNTSGSPRSPQHVERALLDRGQALDGSAHRSRL